MWSWLLLLPQRYAFSSKSQPYGTTVMRGARCCCYHKGTYFQANHNMAQIGIIILVLLLLPQRYVFSSKSQRLCSLTYMYHCCCCYHKGTYFQANHNLLELFPPYPLVVVATTKVRIFKQITTKP